MCKSKLNKLSALKTIQDPDEMLYQDQQRPTNKMVRLTTHIPAAIAFTFTTLLIGQAFLRHQSQNLSPKIRYFQIFSFQSQCNL